MRKQYHFQKSDRGLLAWDIDRLIALSKVFPPMDVYLNDIKELEENYWFDAEGDKPTCKKVIEHARLINEVDMQFPIILSSGGRVMDGMHRVCRAFMEKRETIRAVRFEADPEPDYIGVPPDHLPYEMDARDRPEHDRVE